MRLAASINLYDGAELLRPLARSLRTSVAHLSVVYQQVSNRGAPLDRDLAPALEQLCRDGLLDEVHRYEPARWPGTRLVEHEARKRSIGLGLARAAGATHFMALDVDEFVRPAELRRAMDAVEAGGYDATACRAVEYHRRPTYRRTALSTYRGMPLYVPLIAEIRGVQAFDPDLEYFCCVDPSRRMPARRPWAFPPEEVVVHHMTTVRASRDALLRKFENSTSRSRLVAPECLADVVWDFDATTHERPEVVVVPDEFGIGAALDTAAAQTSHLATPQGAET